MTKKYLILILSLLIIGSNSAFAIETKDLEGILNEDTLKLILSSEMKDFLKKGSDFIEEKAKNILEEKIKEIEINNSTTTSNTEIKPDSKGINFKDLLEKSFEWLYSILKKLFDWVLGLISKS